MNTGFSFFWCLCLKKEYVRFLIIISSVFCSSVFCALLEDLSETGHVYVLETIAVDRDIESGTISFTIAPYMGEDGRRFDTLEKFMVSGNDGDNHRFFNIFLNEKELNPCCPPLENIDYNATVDSELSKLSVKYDDDDESECETEDKGRALLELKGEGIEFLMGDDANIYAVIRGVDHPYNSYEFESIVVQDGTRFPICQEVNCNKFSWASSVIDGTGNGTVSEKYRGFLGKYYYGSDKNTIVKKKYDCFVFKLDINDRARDNILDCFSGRQRNALSGIAPMVVNMKATERRNDYFKLKSGVVGFKNRKDLYAWCYNIHSFYDSRASLVDVMVFNKDLFSKEFVHIPCVTQLYQDGINKEYYPVHFNIKNDGGYLIVDVYIEPNVVGGSTAFKSLKGIHTYLTTYLLKKNTSHILNVSDCVVKKKCDYQVSKEFDGDKLHISFKVPSDFFNDSGDDCSIGFKFNLDDGAGGFWKKKDLGCMAWKITGDLKSGGRDTYIDAFLGDLEEKQVVFSSNPKYAYQDPEIKSTKINGKILFEILESACTLSDNDYRSRFRGSVSEHGENDEGTYIEEVLIKSKMGEALVDPSEGKSKGKAIFKMIKNKASPRQKQSEHWLSNTNIKPLFEVESNESKKSDPFEVDIKTRALVLGAMSRRDISEVGQATITENRFTYSLVSVDQKANQEIIKTLGRGVVISLMHDGKTMRATFKNLPKNASLLTLHDNFCTSSYMDIKSTGCSEGELLIAYNSRRSYYFAGYSYKKETENASQRIAVNALSRVVSSSGRKISDIDVKEQTERYLMSGQNISESLIPEVQKQMQAKEVNNTSNFFYRSVSWLSGGSGGSGGSKAGVKAIEDSSKKN